MPPRNKGVANPFAGCVITVCGRPGTIDGKRWYHQDFKTIIVKWGGRSVRNVTDATTHVVATKDSLCGDTAIMAAARRRENISLMKPEWLIHTESKKKKLNAKEYAWTDLEKLRVSQLKTQRAKTKTAKKIAEAEARVKDEPKEDGETLLKTSAKPKTAKPKAAEPKTAAQSTTAAKTKKTSAKPKKTAPKPKAAEPKTAAQSTTAAKPKPAAKSETKPKKTSAKPKPAAKSETKPKKTPAKPKPAAKSETKAKAKPKKAPAEPKTSVEPLTEYDVWVDDSDLIYDAYLTQTSSVTNRDRVYCIQVMKDPESSTFKTRTKWGGVGKTPMYQVLGNGGHEEAVEIFKERFKSKTGLDWENRLADPIPENYTYDGATDHS
ncbi:Poly [ADP-ribose] polymerase 2 [Fusarium oxysporum f. sp. raphani]|uniref:NAD(+) ADP-ribosyltransferase n=1 Tax=Fusarium oxysporum f. sp. raphani TaxID=96318 RepID=A0A8J5NRT9_FUSOX|nr:Poly [ADP-ribose] polymerase 2 [Fusarium oxysporum f. sp. raphani]